MSHFSWTFHWRATFLPMRPTMDDDDVLSYSTTPHKSHMNHDEVIAPYATATAATNAQLQPK